MGIKIAKDGTESEIRSAVDYLKSRYGIPPEDVRFVSVEAEAGKPILITVAMYVQEPEPAPEPLGLTEQQRMASDMAESIDYLTGRTSGPSSMWGA